MRIGITTKVIFLALLCAILPSVLISLVAYSSSRAALQQAIEAELSDLTKHQMAQLFSSLKSAATNLETWSTLHVMQNVLTDDNDGTIQDELISLQKRYQVFGNLLVLTPDGTVVSEAMQPNKAKNLRSSEFLAAALGGAGYRGSVGYQELVGATGLVMASPIHADYDPATVVGVLVGVVDWSRIQLALSSVRIWGAAQDTDHRLVLQTGDGERLYDTDVSSMQSTGLNFSKSGVQRIDLGNRSYLVGTQIASPPADWVLHAMVSTDVAYAGVTVLRNRIAAISAAILLVAVLLGTLASGRLVAPIRSVTIAMQRVSTGNRDVDLKGVHRKDEIGQMLRAITEFRNKLEQDNAVIREREHSLRTQNLRFDAALGNMSQGLSMFDRQGCLIVCNHQFSVLYDLPAPMLVPGTSQKQILENLASVGSCSSLQAEQYLQRVFENARNVKSWDTLFEAKDHRIVAISHRPMADGGWVSTHEDITERRRAEAQIAHMARHDGLTNLPNRISFRESLQEALSRDEGKGLAVLCLDLDRFKNVNDTLGHPIGDVLLQKVAIRLRQCVGETGVIARLGGDEFAILQSGADRPTDTTGLAQSIIEALSVPYEIEDHHIIIGTSVGVAIAPTDGNDPDQLIKNADLALYRGKADGRGMYRFFEPEMDAKMQARRRLELDLRKALARGEFILHYQPLVNIDTQEIVAFEALVRWRHPERGLIGPDDFIPLTEEIGLITPLGEWILRQACLDAATWPPQIKVSVNLSPVQFRSPNLVLAVFNALAASQIAATRLDLEITESVLLHESGQTLTILHQLHNMGVRISMDDFGTGYSSLSYLQKFPFNKIKIDKSFVQNLETRAESVAIIRAVTGLSRSLGIITTAEGVETAEQLARLQVEGCTEIQGFYISPPCPVSEVAALLKANEAQREVG